MNSKQRKSTHYAILKSTCNCNFNCKYCFDKPLKQHYGNAKMSEETLRHIIRLESEYAESVTLDLFGGEPTLMSTDYYRLIDSICSENYISDFKYVMQSNGYIPSTRDEWVELWADLDVNVNFSYDVTTQELRNPNFKFEKLLKLCKNVTVNNINGGGIITVLNRKNITDAIEIYDMIIDNPSTVLTFNLLNNSSDESEKGLALTREDMFTSFRKFIEHVIRNDSGKCNDLERASTTYIAVLLDWERDVTCEYSDCTKSWLNYMPDGQVAMCSRPSKLIVDKYGLGNILDYNSIEELYNSPRYKSYLEDIEYRKHTYCDNCGFLDMCHGLCHTQHSHKHGGSVRYIDETLCQSFKDGIILAYDILADITLDESLMNAFVVETLAYSKFIPCELSHFLHSSGLTTDCIDFKIDIKKSTEAPYEFVNNPKFKLLRLMNTLLDTEVEFNTKQYGQDIHTFRDILPEKELIFKSRIEVYSDTVKALLYDITGEEL